MKHLLVTNDFPPKIGGIQSYLWELWRRLPADDATVLTTAYPGAEAFDRAAGFRIDRVPDRVLLDLETRQGAWPPLFLPMRALPASDPSNAGGASFGGS